MMLIRGQFIKFFWFTHGNVSKGWVKLVAQFKDGRFDGEICTIEFLTRYASRSIIIPERLK